MVISFHSVLLFFYSKIKTVKFIIACYSTLFHFDEMNVIVFFYDYRTIKTVFHFYFEISFENYHQMKFSICTNVMICILYIYSWRKLLEALAAQYDAYSFFCVSGLRFVLFFLPHLKLNPIKRRNVLRMVIIFGMQAHHLKAVQIS